MVELGRGRTIARERNTYNFIGVHDGLETVGNGDNRHVLLKLSPQRLLDYSVRFIIDRGCR